MAALPYMYFFPAEYLNDTQHLTREQHGAYLLLLMHYWQSGKAINNSNGRLAVVAKMTHEEWAKEESLYAEFFDVDGDIWSHGRMEFDLERVRIKSKQASYAGRRSAESKKGIPNGTQMELQNSSKSVPNELENNDSGVLNRREINARSTDVESSFNETSTINKEINKNLVQTSFEQFWNLYPRRDGKKKAKTSFEKALKITSIEVLLEGVARYIAFLKTNTQTPAMAVTWLNGERWTDEVLAIANNSPKPLPHGKVTDLLTGELYCQNCGSAWPCLTESKKGGPQF